LRSLKYTRTTTCTELPADAERTTASEQPTFVWSQGSTPSPQAPTPHKLIDYINIIDRWAICSLDTPQEGAKIARAIIHGNAIAICDGSYKDHFGTAGFAIQTWDQQDLCILGAHVTPGHTDDQNPYQSGVGGIFAIVIIVEAICARYDITEGTIDLGCDCESALTAIFEHVYDIPSQPHHDLIHAIHSKLAVSPVTWKFWHIRGHQDKHVPFHLLGLWGQLNVEMDSPAKTYWNETQSVVMPFYPSNTCGWSLWIGPRKLSTWDRTALYNHALGTDIHAH
jgi:hypothetical protein